MHYIMYRFTLEQLGQKGDLVKTVEGQSSQPPSKNVSTTYTGNQQRTCTIAGWCILRLLWSFTHDCRNCILSTRTCTYIIIHHK